MANIGFLHDSLQTTLTVSKEMPSRESTDQTELESRWEKDGTKPEVSSTPSSASVSNFWFFCLFFFPPSSPFEMLLPINHNLNFWVVCRFVVNCCQLVILSASYCLLSIFYSAEDSQRKRRHSCCSDGFATQHHCLRSSAVATNEGIRKRRFCNSDEQGISVVSQQACAP
jgi:hypothetical protein